MADTKAPPAGEPDRKAFEAWFEADAMPLEHSNWFRRDAGGLYEIASVEHSWCGWKAASRLGRASRPKVEDAEVAAMLEALDSGDPDQTPTPKECYDLLQRLVAQSITMIDVAYEANETIKVAESKLAELEAELAKVRDLIWFYVDPMDITPEYKAAYEAAIKEQEGRD